MVKLTIAQRDLLFEVYHGDDKCSDTYQPGQQLVVKGLLTWATDTRLALTQAGREFVETSNV